jgi:5'(3')-deoxyribonucleotidase
MIKTIFLDMDGVITDFLKGLHKALGVSYSYENYHYEKNKWDMLTDIKLSDGTPVTFEECNDCCTTKFWAELPWMHDGRDILRAIMDTLSLEKVYLLTTPMPNLESASGKMMWVNTNLPIWLKRTIITRTTKSLLAQPSALLIDDKNENVEEFIAAGGQGILVPRPWNREFKNSDISAKVVREHLEALC